MMAQSEIRLSATGIEKSFGAHSVLDGISLTAGQGDLPLVFHPAATGVGS